MNETANEVIRDDPADVGLLVVVTMLFSIFKKWEELSTCGRSVKSAWSPETLFAKHP